jgi:nucleoside-diphosphate-sugar epimerase
MRCLVTGGGGFIGSAIVTKLVEHGHTVVAMGRLNRPHRIPDNIITEVEFVEGDIKDLEAVGMATKHCEIIYHFAGVVDSDTANGLSVDAIETEVLGLKNICQSAFKFNVKKIIYGSSCAVYGDDKQVHALTEESPVHPKSHYAVLKRTGELLLKSYSEEQGLNHLILRIFNPYGINQPKNMAIHRFFDAAIHNRPIHIYGAGNQTRDFIYIDDVACMAILAGEKEIRSKILNVCTGKDRSIRTVAETIILMSGSASKCEFLPLPSGRNEAEFFRSFGSIEKIKGNLGFGSIIRLEDGLKRMYEDMVSETRMV